MVKFFAGVLLTSLIFGGLALGYFFGFNQAKKPAPPASQSSPSVSLPAAPEASLAATPTPAPQGLTREAISRAVTAKDYAPLASRLTDPVSVILYATECCGPLEKAKALKQLEYLNDGTPPWNFDPANPLVAKLQTADPGNFAQAIVGTSGNNFVVAFHLNDQGKIDKIFISADYKLILP